MLYSGQQRFAIIDKEKTIAFCTWGTDIADACHTAFLLFPAAHRVFYAKCIDDNELYKFGFDAPKD